MRKVVFFSIFLCVIEYGTAGVMVEPVNFTLPLVKKPKKMQMLYKNTVHRGRVQDANLSWEWGQRIGIIYGTERDEWNLIAAVSRFHSGSFSSVKTEQGDLQPTWDKVPSKRGEKEWRLHVNLADLEFGRNIAGALRTTVRPHVGMRTLLMQPRNILRTEGVLRASQCMGAGMRSGVDTLMRVRDRLHLFADGALSYLPKCLTPQPMAAPISGQLVMGEASFGVQYRTAALAHRPHMIMRMGYEMNHLFSHATWMPWLFGAVPHAKHRGLSLQAITAGMTWHF